jgi:hypothetical protein
VVRQLLDGTYKADYVIGTSATHDLLTLAIDMTTSNLDYNVDSRNFDVNSLGVDIFAGVSGLRLKRI